MRFITGQSAFSKGLSTVKYAVSSSIVEAMSNVKIETTMEEGVYLTATNGQVGVETKIEAMPVEPGYITVQHSMLSSIVSNLSAPQIELSVNEADMVNVTAGRQNFDVQGLPVDSFPLIYDVGTECSEFVFAADHLLKVLQYTHWSSAAPEMTERPVLAGVHMKTEDGKLISVGADGYRLTQVTTAFDDPADSLRITIPINTVRMLLASVRPTDEDVIMRVSGDESHASFEFGNTRVTTSLLMGTYPVYGGLIPDDVKTTVEIDTEEFRSIVQSAAVFQRGAKISDPFAKFETSEESNDVSLNVRDMMSSDQYNGIAEAQTTGPSNRIAFNANYLRDMVESIKGFPVIKIGLNDQNSPAVVLLPEYEDFVHVIMPLFVDWDE